MIRQSDGIHIEGSQKVIADARSSSGDLNIVSHAHSDHVNKKLEKAVCSKLTAQILRKRFDMDVKRQKHESVKLINSGHILGSSAALIDNQTLYTGDVSTRKTAYLDGFQPVKAQKLIIESTYGIPAYRFPDQKQIEAQITDWVKDTEKPLILFAYSLGKAQKIQHIVQNACDRDIIAHGAVKKMNDVIESSTDLNFRAKSYKENKKVLDQNGILIAPSRSARADWIQKLVKKTGAKKAGFSGWATDSSFKYRGDYDRCFTFSDHCDFDELVELVCQVDPEKVYTQHGFDEAFASYLKREKGYNARALKNNQSSLTDF